MAFSLQRVGKCETKAYQNLQAQIVDIASKCKLPGMLQALPVLKVLQFSMASYSCKEKTEIKRKRWKQSDKRKATILGLKSTAA